MSSNLIRVDRGDGRLFQFNEADAKAFIAANPGAHVVPGRNASTAPTPAEVAATAVAQGEAPAKPKTLSTMNRDELLALAADRGVDVSEAKNMTELRVALGMRRQKG